MNRTVPHQHRNSRRAKLGQRLSIAREDVSRGRLGCPTCPRVGDPRPDTRPPPYSTAALHRSARRADAELGRAAPCVAPVKGAEATSDVLGG